METKQVKRFYIFFTLIAGTFITSMTVTVTANMLPAIMYDLQIASGTAQWLTSGATLVSGIMIPIATFLMKRISARQYFLSAMLVFCGGAFLGSIAQGFTVLLIGRLIQAVGCGMLLPFSQVVLMAVYPKEKHGMVISAYAVGSTVASVVAPTLAGLIIDLSGWQSVFTVLFVGGAVIVVLGAIFMKNVTKQYQEQFQLIPILLSMLGFSGILIGFGNLSGGTFLQWKTAGAMTLGVLSLSIFVYLQLHAQTPFLNLRVFANSKFRMAVIMSMLMYLICMGSGTLLPVFAQSLQGRSASIYALVTLPGAVAMATVTLCSGRIYDKYGPRLLLTGGTTMMLVGSILGMVLREESGLLHIGLVSCLLSVGTGFLNAPITTMSLSNLEGKNRVDGSAVLNTLRQISSSLASTLGIMIYTIVSVHKETMVGIQMAYTCYIGIAILTAMVVFNFIKTEGQLNL